MERDERAAKVGAGGAALCHQCSKPFRRALGDDESCAGALGDCEGQQIKETSAWLLETWTKSIKRDSEALANERATRKARLEVFLGLFRQVDVSFDGHQIKFFGGPLIDAYKSLRAIYEVSPLLVEQFFKNQDFAALALGIETMTTPTGELHATFNPSVALVEFIAAHRADDGD